MHIPVKQYYTVVIPGGFTARWAFWWRVLMQWYKTARIELTKIRQTFLILDRHKADWITCNLPFYARLNQLWLCCQQYGGSILQYAATNMAVIATLHSLIQRLRRVNAAAYNENPIFKYQVHVAQRTHRVSVTKTNRMMMIRMWQLFTVRLVTVMGFIGWAGIANSVQRLDTGWTVQGSNPGGGEIFHTCPDRPWGLPPIQWVLGRSRR